jgi:hypothetical protein
LKAIILRAYAGKYNADKSKLFNGCQAFAQRGAPPARLNKTYIPETIKF